MRRKALAAAIIAVVAALVAPVAATQPSVQAQAYHVRSGLDGEVLAERRGDEQRAIASITKLMTVLVALGRTSLDEVVTVSPEISDVGGSTVFLEPGDRVTVRDLVRAALVPSANDAATALAAHAGGSVARFVRLMNAKARSLGLRDTRFANPHGLDAPGHYSTARDVVRLAQAALRDPVIQKISRLRSITIGDRTYEATDDLVDRLPEAIGGKTGQTSLAGWSQVAGARERGVTVFASVLGGSSEEQRNDDLEALLRWALDAYVPILAVSSARTYGLAETAYGRPDVRLVAPKSIIRAARVGRPLTERIVAPTHVPLPVEKGQQLGEIRVFDGERLVAVSPLIAAESVAAPGTAGKIGWYAKRTAHHLAGLVT